VERVIDGAWRWGGGGVMAGIIEAQLG
jgi:hypothetical protein